MLSGVGENRLKVRSTEIAHAFTAKLFGYIPIFSLQGLTLDSNYNFSAGIEATEFERFEKEDPLKMFPSTEWIGKLCLCQQLSVPLFSITYSAETNFISVYSVTSGPTATLDSVKNSITFAQWWAKLKGTQQTKPLYEASSRLSVFDEILAKHGLAWGGNIDGFLINTKQEIIAIIESRYSTKAPLEKYDPAIFYPPHYTRAGDYNTWKPVVLLASKLRVPLYLFTFERESLADRIGFSVVSSMSKAELLYQTAPPYQNIVIGLPNIKAEIRKYLSSKPPVEI